MTMNWFWLRCICLPDVVQALLYVTELRVLKEKLLRTMMTNTLGISQRKNP